MALEQDYLMRIVLQYAEILRRSWFKARGEKDPKGAADMLEAAVGEATDIDGDALLSLAPESMASVLQVSGTDPRVCEYIARSLLLASAYLREAGQGALADVRLEQARALAEAYGLDIPATPEEMASLMEEEASEAEHAIIDIEAAYGEMSAPQYGAIDASGQGSQL